jgi:precorrin-6x reductase
MASGEARVRAGRMDSAEMAAFMRAERFFAVIDATHPYAVEVTANIKIAAEAVGIPYLRLLRASSELSGTIIVSSIAEAAERLNTVGGNALLTTGSKELRAFTRVAGYAERMYPRVLPTAEAIGTCLALGFKANHIIAMHGPFSEELNAALMRQFDIETLVTKDGGAAGGFPEKLTAAREFGARVIVIARPPDSGGALEQIIAELREMLGSEI